MVLNTNVVVGDPGHVPDHNTIATILNGLGPGSTAPFDANAADIAAVAAAAAAGATGKIADAGHVHPGLTAGNAQTITAPWTFDAGNLLDAGSQVYDVRAFGIVGGSSADQSAAYQAMLNSIPAGSVILHPRGQIILNNITIPVDDLDFVGMPGINGNGTTLTCTTGSLFVVGAAQALSGISFRNMSFLARAASGHIFNLGTGSLSYWTWDRCNATMQDAGYSILYGSDVTLIDCQWKGGISSSGNSNTVPPFNLASSQGAINDCRFTDSRHTMGTTPGTPVIAITSTSTSAYNYGNVISRWTMENPQAGMVHLTADFGSLIEQVKAYDLAAATTADLIKVDANAGGLGSRRTTIRNCYRLGGALGAGLYDINLVSVAGPVVDQSDAIGTATVNFNGNPGLLIGGDQVTSYNDTNGVTRVQGSYLSAQQLQANGTESYVIYSGNPTNGYDKTFRIYGYGSTQAAPMMLSTNGIDLTFGGHVNPAPTTPALPANPPVSGTVYQNTTGGPIDLDIPITYNGNAAVATAAFALGSTSAPAQWGAVESEPVGSVNGIQHTRRLTVPNGWYWSVTVTNATIGTVAVLGS